MNMQILYNSALKRIYFLLAILILTSCKEDDKGVDEFVVNSVTLLPPNAGKIKPKTDQQYVAILHANLFQVALSANQIFEISQCIESIGDKEVAREVIISNFMNKPGVKMPTNEEMRADLRKFITDTFNRFLVRHPTESEIEYFENYLTANPGSTPELVYFSFSLSNEYLFY